MFLKPTMYERLEQLKDSIHVCVNATTTAIDSNGLTYKDQEGNETRVIADTVLYAVGSVANSEVVEELRAWDGWESFFPVGDCTGAGIIRKAIHGAYFAALDII
jgi:thioredoxin reductase